MVTVNLALGGVAGARYSQLRFWVKVVMHADGDKTGKYGGLSKDQLVRLLEKRDRERKLGLVWERNEIEADRALDGEFVSVVPLPDLHEGHAPWANLVIEGDNFDALRWLRMTWARRIKCIYVDPPYNTGNKDWVYNDHYVDKQDRWRHSTWLEFLYRRFALARDLLTEDGVILVSINDENRAKLELLLDEVLPGMRVGSFVWRTRAGTAGEKPFFGQDHEHILVYAGRDFAFGGQGTDVTKYKDDGDPRGAWTSVALQTNKDRRERPGSYFPIQHPTNGSWHPCNPNRVWSFQLRGMESARGLTYEDMLQQDLVLFSNEETFLYYETLKDLRHAIEQKTSHPYLKLDLPDLERWVRVKIGTGSVRKKQFLNALKRDTRAVSSWIDVKSAKPDKGSDKMVLQTTGTQGGTATIIELFGHKAFNYPKPPSLLKSLVEQSTRPGDVVLDFFAGSATTAQAVMELNDEDGGDRRFIMVSSTEATPEQPDKNICRDVTAARVRLLNRAKDGSFANLDAEFAYLRCRKLSFEDLDYDLTPEETWVALQALHQLPLMPYEPGPISVYEADDFVLVYVDRCDDDLAAWFAARARPTLPTFVYAWAPGQVRERLRDVDVELRGVREVLVSRSRQ